MLIHPLWTDGYRLLLMQLYLRKPVGMKAIYSKAMVNLSLELHIPPAVLYEQMFMLRNRKMPSIARLWDRYGENTSRLARDVKKLRSLTGFCNASEFYSGVETSESFEKDFRTIDTGDTGGGHAGSGGAGTDDEDKAGQGGGGHGGVPRLRPLSE